MGSPRARIGLGVRDRGGDGLLYSPPRLFSTKYTRNAQYARGPSSLHDPSLSTLFLPPFSLLFHTLPLTISTYRFHTCRSMSSPSSFSPSFSEVEEAMERVREVVHFTPVLTSSHLDSLAGHSLFFKCETFQKTGLSRCVGIGFS